jgi:hypothetical protein
MKRNNVDFFHCAAYFGRNRTGLFRITALATYQIFLKTDIVACKNSMLAVNAQNVPEHRQNVSQPIRIIPILNQMADDVSETTPSILSSNRKSLTDILIQYIPEVFDAMKFETLRYRYYGPEDVDFAMVPLNMAPVTDGDLIQGVVGTHRMYCGGSPSPFRK